MSKTARQFLLFFLVVTLSIGLGKCAQASIITTPTDLSPGDEYRLVFVTSGSIRPSDFIEDYNNFVDGYGDTILPGDWKAIASTFHSDDVQMSARDNTGTQGEAMIPIYNLIGERVADGYGDLWDGSIQSPIQYNEDGDTEINAVLTGTHHTGIIWSAQYYTNFGYMFNDNYLDEKWINFADRYTHDDFWDDDGDTGGPKMYGMSEVLTVQESSEVIPEPASVITWTLLGIVGCVGTWWNRRRKAS